MGIYLSGGIGWSTITVADEFAFNFSGSLAINSHLISITKMTTNYFGNGGSNIGTFYHAKYVGVLFGEAFRDEHFMASASIGIASSEVSYEVVSPYGGPMGTITAGGYNNDLAFPLELKLYALAHNGIGIGLHYSLDMAGKYSPSTYSFSIVLGAWNKARKHPIYFY